MRLREPFQGYKLSSGHFMFHIAYLLGSYISTRIILTKEELNTGPSGLDVLNQLNYAHILVPVFQFCSMKCEMNDNEVLSKVFETVSVFQYQGTIFYA